MTYEAGDRIYETSTTTGTGTYTLAGPVTGFQAFSSLGANNYCTYFATDDTDWEVGIGQVLSGPERLLRETIIASSNSDTEVDWAAGTKKLRCGHPAFLGLPRKKSVSVAGSGDITLSQDEQRCNVLVLTGALTGARSVIVDATPWHWIVVNSTSGSYDLTVKVSGQTGVIVAQGKSKVLYNDGSDVEDATLDSVPTDILETAWIPAGSMTPQLTNGATPAVRELASNDIMLRTMNFPDNGAETYAQFNIGMPKGWNEGTIAFIPYWTHQAGTGDVIWGLQAVAISNDDPLDAAFGTAQTSTDTALTTDDDHIGPQSAAITIAGSPQEGDLIIFRVLRDGDAGGDTLNVAAELIGIRLLFTAATLDDS